MTKRVILAIDLQTGMSPNEIIVREVNELSHKYPTIATVLEQDPNDFTDKEWLNWKAPEHDSCLINTKYVYTRYGYQIPPVIIKMLQKNNIDEVIVTGAHTEAFLLAAGFILFDAGIKTSLIAPLCLTGQFHQHSVTMNIWEHSIGSVYESVAELG